MGGPAAALRKQPQVSRFATIGMRPAWQSSVLIRVCALILIAAAAAAAAAAATTVEKWTVGLSGGMEEANRIAAEIGCTNLGLVTGFNDVYLFARERQPAARHAKNRNEADSSLHRTKRQLELHPSVSWANPQTRQKRAKRGLISRQQQPQLSPVQRHLVHAAGQQSARGASVSLLPAPGRTFNDELWTHQWYLQDNSNVAQFQSDIDLRVQEVWRMGFTGNGVVVTILDDGLEWNHTDIYPNYDPLASYDMIHNRDNPFPLYNRIESNSHGTRCAGEVAMVADNKKCGVGVAPRARIGGIKCIDDYVENEPAVEAMSLIHNFDHIDIYSGSWGPKDEGFYVDGPKREASMALERGARFGRQGKGALYIWANGNGGEVGDNCNCDGFVTSIYTIAIGAVSQQGQMPSYGERCSSTLAVACSNGAYTDRKIVTTDLHNKCTTDFDGTSAAAPLAAGIFALVLEANGNITWRDAQHLTAWTSNPIPLRDNPGWKRNAAGLLFNNRFGFGLLNAKAMVDAALNWRNVPQKSICRVSPRSGLSQLQSRQMAQVFFVTDGCQQRQQQPQQPQFSSRPQQRSGNYAANSDQSQPAPVIYLEHVEVIVDIEYTARGELDIYLVSPSGTISTLLSRRPLDVSQVGFTKWPLMSVHFWGETSQGQWMLIVRDKDSQNNRGQLVNATLVLHGTSIRPHHMQQARVYEQAGHERLPSFIDPVLEWDEEDPFEMIYRSSSISNTS